MMDANKRTQFIKTAWDIHAEVEASYHQHPAIRGDGDAWQEKQRLLLADMALHLLTTALKPGDLEHDLLRNNLHAILTISDNFLPEAQLKTAVENLYEKSLNPEAELSKK